MVDLMLAGDEPEIRAKQAIRTVYDPCCGSGGMLTITKDHITIGLRKNGDLVRPPINKGAEIHLLGQEVNPETWAVSKSDLFMKDPTGRDADNIAYGSTLASDRHAEKRFDYLIANPPYGKDWKRDEDAVRAGAALLQHRHRHLRLGGDQPQGASAKGKGAAHRRHLILDADAQEPG
jgi:type I restriction enzyme M protein